MLTEKEIVAIIEDYKMRYAVIRKMGGSGKCETDIIQCLEELLRLRKKNRKNF